MSRGYFGIGIENGKTPANLGTLWRSAHSLGAAFVFTIGRRYTPQASDTTKAWRSIPLHHYLDWDSFFGSLPYDCRLIGVEFPHERARPIFNFVHPERCVYLLGSEDCGLSKNALGACHHLIYIPTERCINVSAAGSIVMYDRARKEAA